MMFIKNIYHKANTGKCADLGWVCVPVVAESYGAWGLTAIGISFLNLWESRSQWSSMSCMGGGT